MDILKKLFPQAFKCKKSDTNNFVVTLIVYIVMFVIAGVLMWIAGFLTGIPVLGALVARETATITRLDRINAGSSS